MKEVRNIKHGPMDYILNTGKRLKNALKFKSRNGAEKNLSELKLMPIQTKKSQLNLDQTNEAYYGIDISSSKPSSSYTTKTKMRRGKSHNFENNRTRNSKYSDSFSNLASSFSYTNRLKSKDYGSDFSTRKKYRRGSNSHNTSQSSDFERKSKPAKMNFNLRPVKLTSSKRRYKAKIAAKKSLKAVQSETQLERKTRNSKVKNSFSNSKKKKKVKGLFKKLPTLSNDIISEIENVIKISKDRPNPPQKPSSTSLKKPQKPPNSHPSHIPKPITLKPPLSTSQNRFSMENNNRLTQVQKQEVKLNQDIDKEGINQSKRYDQLCTDLENIDLGSDLEDDQVENKQINLSEEEDLQEKDLPNQDSKELSEFFESVGSEKFSTKCINSKRNLTKMTEEEKSEYVREKRVHLLFSDRKEE